MLSCWRSDCLLDCLSKLKDAIVEPWRGLLFLGSLRSYLCSLCGRRNTTPGAGAPGAGAVLVPALPDLVLALPDLVLALPDLVLALQVLQAWVALPLPYLCLLTELLLLGLASLSLLDQCIIYLLRDLSYPVLLLLYLSLCSLGRFLCCPDKVIFIVIVAANITVLA